jgi:hypothetical protein
LQGIGAKTAPVASVLVRIRVLSQVLGRQIPWFASREIYSVKQGIDDLHYAGI